LFEPVEFPDAGLPGHELGSRGDELRHQNYWELKVWLWREDFTCAVVPRYLECVIQWDCHSSSVKIRYQETTSGDCTRLRTLVFAAVNCKVRRLAVVKYIQFIQSILRLIVTHPYTWQYISSNSGAQAVSYPGGTEFSFPGDKAAETWSWLLPPGVEVKEWMELYIHFSTYLHGVVLN
jgi:hypothetical protein